MINIRFFKNILLKLMMTSLILCVFGTHFILAAEPEKPAESHLPGEASSMQDKKTQEKNQTVISNDEVKIFLKGIEFYGSIAKPQTVFIIPGTDPSVDGLQINRHFFSHIFRPVERSTLRRVRMKQGKNKDHILW